MVQDGIEILTSVEFLDGYMCGVRLVEIDIIVYRRTINQKSPNMCIVSCESMMRQKYFRRLKSCLQADEKKHHQWW